MTDELKTQPVDVTESVPPMSLHKYITLPQIDVKMTLKPQEMEFLFSTLARVHTTLVKTVNDIKTPADEAKAAYDFAYNIELIYGTLFAQLKLLKPERTDLN